jgi:hypothetical protein
MLLDSNPPAATGGRSDEGFGRFRYGHRGLQVTAVAWRACRCRGFVMLNERSVDGSRRRNGI